MTVSGGVQAGTRVDTASWRHDINLYKHVRGNRGMAVVKSDLRVTDHYWLEDVWGKQVEAMKMTYQGQQYSDSDNSTVTLTTVQ